MEDQFLASGIDPGDDAWGTCAICGDYIWGNEVECGEAFFEAFDPRPPHHNRCLPEFMRTGKLLPHRMEYYQNPEKFLADECGMSADIVQELCKSSAEQGNPIKPPMKWDEVATFLAERSVELIMQHKESPITLPLALSGSVGIPVFICRSHFRPEILFPDVLTLKPEAIISDEEKTVIRLAQEKQQPLEYVVFAPSKTSPNPETRITREDVCDTGVLAALKTTCNENGEYLATIQALERVKLTWKDRSDSSFVATLTHLPEIKDLDFDSRAVKDKIEGIVMVVKNLQTEAFPPEMINLWLGHQAAIQAGRFGMLLDLFAFCAGQNSMWEDDLFPYRYAVLKASSLSERLDKANELASYFGERARLVKNMSANHAKKHAEEQQKAMLRGQLAMIQKELGEDDYENEEIVAWETQLQKLEMLTPALPPRVISEARKQLRKIKRYKPDDSPYGKLAEWLGESFFALGWDRRTEDNFDLKNVKKVLDEDHYGLASVKDRIIEHVAVLKKQDEYRKLVVAKKANQQNEHKRRTVLCFLGPPGVAKTSLGRSIARAMNRKFYATSFGGVEDEAEVHGFMETYVGSMPGQIIRGLIETGVKNPVFMIDEIDKIKKHRGNPEAAFLAVLDSTLTDGFVDKYMRVPFDLSEVLFIVTANDVSNVMPALLDRMEIIEFPGYTAGEKLEIAKHHLVPKAIAYHHLPLNTEFPDETLVAIRDGWVAKEAGVRNFEQQISKVCRRLLVAPLLENASIEPATLPELLGPKAVHGTSCMSAPEIGVVNGLAYTEVGGTIMTIEVERHIADTKFTRLEDQIFATGNVMEVMKESMLVALARVAKLAEKSNTYGITIPSFEKSRFHVHVAPLATKKDGPSATVTLFVALVSSLSERPVDHTVAMTGELTLRGKTLPVGGLAQKFSAAHREGIKKILYPSVLEETVKHLKQENPELQEVLFMPISTDSEALQHALVPKD